MSFNREVENNPKNKHMDHIPQDMSEVHEHDSNSGFKSSMLLTLPPVCRNNIRNKPQSGFNQSALIQNNGILDFHITTTGYIEKLYLELELTIANNPMTINSNYLIDRVEFLSSESNPFETVYGDNVYFDKIHRSKEEHDRIRVVENYDSSYNGVSVPIGQKRIIFQIPCFIDKCHPKLSILRNNRLQIKIYFSNLGITAFTSLSDLTVNQCDLLQYGHMLSHTHESLDSQLKANKLLNYRFLKPIRFASQTLAMTPGGIYDIRLTSANDMCSHMIFVVRPNPVSATNVNVFQEVEAYELLDKDNTIFTIKINKDYQRLINSDLVGDILNFKNIYVYQFALSVESAQEGHQTGFYHLSTNEQLRLYMPSSGFSAGSFRVDVYGYDYTKLTINNGELYASS